MAKFIYDLWLEQFLKSTRDFDWDFWNTQKIVRKHGIQTKQIEDCFRDVTIHPLGRQFRPVHAENRYAFIGKDNLGLLIFVVFTVRGNRIRVISGRAANKKEREMYAR